MRSIVIAIFITLLTGLLLTACRRDYMPKPRGYFRIALPEKSYRLFDSTCPFRFEYPAYARITKDDHPLAEPYWMNVEFPAFRGKLHLSYKTISDNLPQYLEDTRSLAMKHIPKADAIKNEVISFPGKKVYGMTYQITGSGAASPFQFFLTDSCRHFLRGALYFSVVPNNDSLGPVLDFIGADIDRMINTFEWKETPSKSLGKR
jgi:gliding motility-associated lipoprotein GldD